jgi:hypothetical protein
MVGTCGTMGRKELRRKNVVDKPDGMIPLDIYRPK